MTAARKDSAAKANRKQTRRQPARTDKRSGWQRFMRGVAVVTDLVAVAGLALTGYAGYMSPLSKGGLWGALVLGFGPMLIICLILLIIQLFWHRSGAVIIGAGMLLCAGPVLTFCPLNVVRPNVPTGAETFTLLSYNVHQFQAPGVRPVITSDSFSTATVDYILSTDADIVNMQEGTSYLTAGHSGLPHSMRKALNDRYPYVFTDGKELVVMSKFPLTPVHLDISPEFKGGSVSCYRIHLPSEKMVTLFNVHLASMNMNSEDTIAYKRITGLEKTSLRFIKNELLRKVSTASVVRARMSQQLMRYIRLYGGPNVIVSGDFNDVPGCYTIRQLADAGFHSAYVETGFGPMSTFNGGRMYFCIDHTLYRGSLEPVRTTRGDIRSSDHYPVLTEFYVK
ncbi:MAG: endonuclease/exonuclease/phosphatase family protein [Muribaculaceae bacterium]|nr:endonuclease/exonuclease/phosphatase family protein [Muribaculaceae bacterium]